LDNLPPKFDRYGDALPLIAFVDQFEEVFSDRPQWTEYRQEFLAQLAEAVAKIPRLRLLLSMKDDAVGEILPYESDLSDDFRARYKVLALDRESALDAVIGPFRATGRSFAPGVAERLVDNLRTMKIVNAVGEQRTVEANVVDPVSIQVVCSALWRDLTADVTTITTDHLARYGDLGATLMKFCAQAVIDVAAQEGIPESAVWEWLEQTFITDLGTRGAAYEGVAATGGMPNSVAQAFEERRIFRSEKRGGSVWFELVHDGLIEAIRVGNRLAARLESDAGSDSRPERQLELAKAALADGMPRLAEEHAWSAVHASGHDRRILAAAESLLGELAFAQGRAQVGDDAEALFTAAEEHYRRAAELYEMEQNFRAVGFALAALGRLFMEHGRIADAVDALQSAVTRLPDDSGLHLEFASALRRSGQPQAALGEHGSVLTTAPETVEALVARGAISAKHGDPRSALNDLDNAVRLQAELAERPDVVLARAQAFARLARRS
jgi:tetratricopeptide (TPR) repeat protein